jgi:hypothetical protein
MPTATLDSSGTKIQLFYTDTGPIDSNDYTTLIVYHGCAFTGRTQQGCFSPVYIADLAVNRHVQQTIASRLIQ